MNPADDLRPFLDGVPDAQAQPSHREEPTGFVNLDSSSLPPAFRKRGSSENYVHALSARACFSITPNRIDNLLSLRRNAAVLLSARIEVDSDKAVTENETNPVGFTVED